MLASRVVRRFPLRDTTCVRIVKGEASLFLLPGSAGSCVCVGLLDFSYQRWGEW
jgi:hypothetical protein